MPRSALPFAHSYKEILLRLVLTVTYAPEAASHV